MTLAIVVFAITLPLVAREGAPPRSRAELVLPLQLIERALLPPTDVKQELAADRARGETPLRFAVPEQVQMTPVTHGTWEMIPGGRLWRLQISSAGATDLNLGFSSFWLSEGATLHVYSESENYVQGPYTAEDNKPHNQLWTPVTPGASAVVELFVPNDANEPPRLTLSQIGRGYRDLFHRAKDVLAAQAATCEIDVICPQGDPWRNEIRSVARYTISGNTLCTGTLIMDASGDFRNFFLTANHCGLNSGNAASVVVYWNYESPICGQRGGGSLAQNQSGATFRASKATVDFALIELDDVPDSSFNVFYSGWDRSGTAPAGAVGIHHPGGSEKSISFANSTLTTVDNCIGSGKSTHWNVTWSQGVTEPGSSGSGLWDINAHRLVGTLSGGNSSCSTPFASDCFGKFSVAWGSGNNAASRLRDWLDPQNSGVMNVAGRDPRALPFIVAAGSSLVAESCTPTNGAFDPGETVTVALALRSRAGPSSSNLIATLLATNGVVAPSPAQSYGVLIAGGPAVTRSFSFVSGGLCGSTVTPTLQLQAGTNNLGTASFAFRSGVPIVVFSQTFDAASSLPSNWLNAASGSSGWSMTSTRSDSPPNSVFASEPATVSDATLTSPSIDIVGSNAQVRFAHQYATESTFDGAVLELSVNGGAFVDIIAAGGRFFAGPYNATISTQYNSPIAGRVAWTGSSGQFLISAIDLPPSTAGQSIRLRWRMATDSSNGGTGWFVDSVSVSDGYTCCGQLVAPRIINPSRNATKFAFSFDTINGQTYITEQKSAIEGTNWFAVQTNTGNGIRVSVTNVISGSQRYYRVKTQ